MSNTPSPIESPSASAAAILFRNLPRRRTPARERLALARMKRAYYRVSPRLGRSPSVSARRLKWTDRKDVF